MNDHFKALQEYFSAVTLKTATEDASFSVILQVFPLCFSMSKDRTAAFSAGSSMKLAVPVPIRQE